MPELRLCRVPVGLLLLFALWSASATPTSQRVLTDVDTLAWKSLEGTQLTSDGRWLIYTLRSVEDDGAVVVRSIDTGAERRFEIGNMREGGGNLKVAPSGRWVAFQVGPSQRADSSKVASPDSTGAKHVLVIELSTGRMVRFDDASNFSFAGGRSSAQWIVVHHSASFSPKAVAADVVLQNL